MKMLQKEKVYLEQFRFLKAIRYIISKFIRKNLDPYSYESYSQLGEDRILSVILNINSIGFFVDVGCNHPQKWSNTFLLYKNGWRGINIDANQGLVQLYDRIRPKDINITGVVSNEEKNILFTEFDDPYVSSVDKEHISKWSKHRKIISQKNVMALTLTKILDKNNVPKTFDLLLIDVEGHDYEVLTSLDLSAYHPQIIVIEIGNFDLENMASNPIYLYLKQRGYKIIVFDGTNGYFKYAT